MSEILEYKHLGNAIILQAVQDYKAAKEIVDNPLSTQRQLKNANDSIKEIKKFLKSNYADIICTALDIGKVLKGLEITA